jgi:hypothetical protein
VWQMPTETGDMAGEVDYYEEIDDNNPQPSSW